MTANNDAQNQDAREESKKDAGESADAEIDGTDISQLSELGNQQLDEVTAPEPVHSKEGENNTNLATIRTLESDSQKALQEKKASVADVHQAEQEKKRKKDSNQKKSDTNTNKSSSFSIRKAIIGTLIFFFVASALAVGGYTYYTQDETDSFAQNTVSPQEIVFANDRTEISVFNKSTREIVQSIQAATSTDTEPGAIQNVYFTTAATSSPQKEKRLLSPEEFVGLFDTKIPSSLVRTFEDRFMFGYHYRNAGKPAPFFLFSIDGYENAFAATLFWEGSMEEDLRPLIGPRPQSVSASQQETSGATSTTQATTTATSTQTFPATTTPPSDATQTLAAANAQTEQIDQDRSLLYYYTRRPFTDMVVQNRDTRVLQLENGETRLIYTFPRQDFLLITTNTTTLKEIFDRLSQRRLEG